MARSSREGMKLVTDVGLLPALVQEAFGHDILVQLNALELLTTLSQSGQWRRSPHRRAKRPLNTPPDGCSLVPWAVVASFWQQPDVVL